MLMLKDKFDNIKQPFVISKTPHNNAWIIFSFSPKHEKNFTIILNTNVDEITSIKTKVKHITPPISIIEEIDEFMLSAKFAFCIEIIVLFLVLLDFIPLYSKPFIKEPITWLK